MPRRRKLLSLEDDVIDLLAARENASEYVAELVRADHKTGLTIALSAEERADVEEAAGESDLDAPAWVRLIALYATGRPLAQQLQDAAEAGRKVFHAALADVTEPQRKAAVKSARRGR